jgi:hypothetical protein
MDLKYKDMCLDDVIAWCKANNQVAWLKEEAAKEVPTKKYPRVKNAEGKSVADKSAEPIIEVRPISFIQLKYEFCKKFMPELLPQGSSKKSMREKIAAL